MSDANQLPLTQTTEHLEQSHIKDVYKAPILLAGLVRNCSGGIRQHVRVLQKALERFSNVHWLIVESDSTDDTVEVLTALQLEIRNFQFITLGRLTPLFPQRTARIAHCRNRYLEELSANPVYERVRYLIVADLDGINSELTEEALISCWRRDEWSVCTANQSAPYYDLYALRHSLWCPIDPLREQQFMQPYVGYEDSLRRAVSSKMIRIPQHADWIEVESAFGGLAIYKREALLNARYVGLDCDGREICEHVTFHEQIRVEGFRIFINPEFINAGFTEHTERYRAYPTLKRMIKRLFKRMLGRPIESFAAKI